MSLHSHTTVTKTLSLCQALHPIPITSRKEKKKSIFMTLKLYRSKKKSPKTGFQERVREFTAFCSKTEPGEAKRGAPEMDCQENPWYTRESVTSAGKPLPQHIFSFLLTACLQGTTSLAFLVELLLRSLKCRSPYSWFLPTKWDQKQSHDTLGRSFKTY